MTDDMYNILNVTGDKDLMTGQRSILIVTGDMDNFLTVTRNTDPSPSRALITCYLQLVHMYPTYVK